LPDEIDFAAVGAMDDDAFAELMAGDRREQFLATLIDQLVAEFRPDRAQGVDAVLHVKVWDKPGGGYDHFEVVIRDGTCTASSKPAHDPDLTLKANPQDLRALVTGRAGPRRLALRGRLRVQGDLALGMKLPDWFAFAQ
jgi:putative sterol carrier protein